MPQRPDIRLLPIARHEMGHYVVARALRFRTGDVFIEMPIAGGHRGGADIFPSQLLMSVDDVKSYLQRRVIVLYAGGAAETLTRHENSVNVQVAVKIITMSGLGAEQDHAKVRELIHLLRNVTYRETDPSQDDIVQEQLRELEQPLFGRAVELVNRNADTILGLADALTERWRLPDRRTEMTAAELEALPAVQAIPLL